MVLEVRKVRRMLSKVYFHYSHYFCCKTIRNYANIITNVEKNRSEISHCRLQKSVKNSVGTMVSNAALRSSKTSNEMQPWSDARSN